MKDLAIIACISQDRGLGKDGKLLWNLKPDMQFFRQTTLGHPVVMGGKTYRSIGKPLPGRENIVLTREPEIPGVRVFHDKIALDEFLEQTPGLKFIIGGAALYSDYLDRADTLYLTEVRATKPADVYFPEFQPSDFDREVLSQNEVDGIKFEIVKYRRRS